MTRSRFGLGAFAPWMLALALGTSATSATTFHVDPKGNDAWSGALAAANPGKTDGPFATLARARDAARALRAANQDKGPGAVGSVTVLVHAGRYELGETLVFTPEDSGTAAGPTVFAAAPGDEGRVVVSGGTVVSGWSSRPGPRGEWVAELPGLKQGWRFRHVSVNGQWRGRSRLPASGAYTMAGLAGANPKAKYDTPARRFEYAPGQVDPSWTNPHEVEAVVLHFWVDSHFRIAAIDPTARVVTLDRPSRRKFTDDYELKPARYYLTNVYESLGPGQFHANPSTGTLHYQPLPGETPTTTTLVAPRLTRLVAFRGDPRAGRFVEHVSLRGLTFADTTYEPGPTDAVDGQAASEVTAALTIAGARAVVVERCTLQDLGGYAIEVGAGCQGVQILGNTLSQIGAGGVAISGGDASSPEPLRTVGTVVRDNRLLHLGRLFHSGVGVLLRHASGSTVTHNEIADLYYTGVSVGWVWGYGPSVSRDNTIAFNHIHHIGQGMLSDMGGVYTLGVSPGTVVRNNWIHDVEAHGYGGWGLYTDEGSTGIVLEDNLVDRTTHGGFHQHYGRDNLVRNNILAFARVEQLARTRDEPHRSFTFERNIVVYRTGQLFGHNWSGGVDRIALDRNVYWNVDGATPTFPAGSFEAWQARGFDRHSVVADPRFQDVDHDDYRLEPGSPALSLGFRPIDVSRVGPRR